MKKIKTTLFQYVLQKYLNPIFIETGTADGGGVEAALNAGFSRIYSIEINQERQLNNILKFNQHKEVTLITGDSIEELERILPMIDQPVTFWLDAHLTRKYKGAKTRCPLYDELEAIKNMSLIKSHTIMIDDMRVVGKETWGRKIAQEEIINRLLAINPNYQISFEDNRMAPHDIMVARL